jgi:hypothetical protein
MVFSGVFPWQGKLWAVVDLFEDPQSKSQTLNSTQKFLATMAFNLCDYWLISSA